MEKIILRGDYYGRLLEVTITDTIPHNKIEFIPDSVKDQVWEGMREDMDHGDFTIEDTGDCAGSWRFLQLEFSLMHRIYKWQTNFDPEESLDKELFMRHFGQHLGTELYEKWTKVCYRDIFKMVAYLGFSNQLGQDFCNMLMEQVNKYHKRKYDEKKKTSGLL